MYFSLFLITCNIYLLCISILFDVHTGIVYLLYIVIVEAHLTSSIMPCSTSMLGMPIYLYKMLRDPRFDRQSSEIPIVKPY